MDQTIDVMNSNIDGLKSQTINLQENIQKTKVDPEKIFNELREKNIIMEKNREIIRDKMKILEGRNRMLQLSMDKNIFYKKVVYILLSITIAIIIIIIFGMSFFKSN